MWTTNLFHWIGIASIAAVITATVSVNPISARESQTESLTGELISPARHQRAFTCPSGGLRPYDQIHVTVEHLQQRQYLIDGLAVAGLVEQKM